MILTNGDHEVCYLHIPRTGGRYVANLLVANGYDYTKDFPGSGYRTIHYKGKELLHLDLSEERDIASTCNRDLPEKRFTVIRNPIDRFVSFGKMYESYIRLLGMTWQDMENPTNFQEVMEKIGFIGGQEGQVQELFFGFRGMGNNACADQRNFIDDTVKVWKFEDGLGKPFVEWLNDEIGLSVKQVKVEYKTRSFDTGKIEISNKVIQNLERYFKDEIEFFGYYLKF